VANVKPYVTVACICEKALQEKDEVLSLVRIVDIFNIQKFPENLVEEGVAAVLEFTVVVTLKSGDLRGRFEVGLSLRPPAGEAKELLPPQPVVLTGDERGPNLIARVQLKVEEYGLFWCDVMWEKEVLTSIPFRLKLKEDEATEQPKNLS
jgi:hypothetical protein